MRRWIVAVALVAALGFTGAAEAGGLRITMGRAPHHQVHPGCVDHYGRHVCRRLDSDRYRHHHHRYWPQPVLIDARASCLVPGYWATQWVPQTAVHGVWIPGYWSDGGWIAGYYVQRPWISGYMRQSVWVPERWAC